MTAGIHTFPTQKQLQRHQPPLHAAQGLSELLVPSMVVVAPRGPSFATLWSL